MLVIDDLHWSEQSTILLIRHLVRSAEPMRLLIVVTYRDTELRPAMPLTNFLADLPSDSRVDRMPLEGLDLSAVSDMVSGVGGHGHRRDGPGSGATAVVGNRRQSAVCTGDPPQSGGGRCSSRRHAAC